MYVRMHVCICGVIPKQVGMGFASDVHIYLCTCLQLVQIFLLIT